jgi:hypothetical protein
MIAKKLQVCLAAPFAFYQKSQSINKQLKTLKITFTFISDQPNKKGPSYKVLPIETYIFY